MADMYDLESYAEKRESSSLSGGTKHKNLQHEKILANNVEL